MDEWEVVTAANEDQEDVSMMRTSLVDSLIMPEVVIFQQAVLPIPGMPIQQMPIQQMPIPEVPIPEMPIQQTQEVRLVHTPHPRHQAAEEEEPDEAPVIDCFIAVYCHTRRALDTIYECILKF